MIVHSFAAWCPLASYRAVEQVCGILDYKATNLYKSVCWVGRSDRTDIFDFSLRTSEVYKPGP